MEVEVGVRVEVDVDVDVEGGASLLTTSSLEGDFSFVFVSHRLTRIAAVPAPRIAIVVELDFNMKREVVILMNDRYLKLSDGIEVMMI